MSKLKSVMKHKFSEIPSVTMQRSQFDRSHGYKTTFDAGFLIPVFVDEALPGDTFNLNMTAFARLATPIKPIMDNLFMDSFFFAVPIRLLWDNWQKFNGEQINPGDSTSYLVPQIDGVLTCDLNSLGDYFGLPVGITYDSMLPNALHHRAYKKVWNEWFRDENLQDSLAVSLGDGPDTATIALDRVERRGKRHDYFTSCLPWPQKGTAVQLPLGSAAPVVSVGTGVPTFDVNNLTNVSLGTQNTADPGVFWSSTPANVDPTAIWNTTSLEADLSTATAATINQLREAFQIQRLYERDARGGTRYIEILKSHFGVTSPDSRLQRSEFLGGGSTPISIMPIPQTSFTSAGTTPQGNVSAYGTVILNGHGFTKSFVEHCVLIGLVSVRADLTYQQGLNRMWSRQIRWDYYWPALAHIGEQAVLNKEIFADGSANDDLVFGYQERYAEYRYKPSSITSLFRSTQPSSLDLWHLSIDFSSLPLLNSSFIQENPPIDRIIAVPSEPHFLFDSYFNLKCARPMPTYGVPGLIDHF